MDFGDEEGFHTAIGSQSIIVNPGDLDQGDWYIGVYNVWGYTGFEQESDASASFALYVNLYAAGTPCPRFEGRFCNQQPSTAGGQVVNMCDFNTGKCVCSDNYYGPDCSIYAQPIPLVIDVDSTTTLSDRTLLVGHTEYFGVKINQTVISNGLNLVIDLSKRHTGDTSSPVMLARFNDVPYAVDSDKFDDHDFLSNYRHDDNHRIVLDNDEIVDGIAVISVFNGAENLESADLNYDLTVSFQSDVQCPTGFNGQVCSGRGTCKTELGRCDCDQGYTLDDCSAYGIYQIDISNSGEGSVEVVASDNMHIQPDGWVFYAVPIGCVKQGMHFDLQVDSTSSSSSYLPKIRKQLGIDQHSLKRRHEFRKLETSSVCKNWGASTHD